MMSAEAYRGGPGSESSVSGAKKTEAKQVVGRRRPLGPRHWVPRLFPSRSRRKRRKGASPASHPRSSEPLEQAPSNGAESRRRRRRRRQTSRPPIHEADRRRILRVGLPPPPPRATLQGGFNAKEALGTAPTEFATPSPISSQRSQQSPQSPQTTRPPPPPAASRCARVAGSARGGSGAAARLEQALRKTPLAPCLSAFRSATGARAHGPVETLPVGVSAVQAGPIATPSVPRDVLPQAIPHAARSPSANAGGTGGRGAPLAPPPSSAPAVSAPLPPAESWPVRRLLAPSFVPRVAGGPIEPLFPVSAPVPPPPPDLSRRAQCFGPAPPVRHRTRRSRRRASSTMPARIAAGAFGFCVVIGALALFSRQAGRRGEGSETVGARRSRRARPPFKHRGVEPVASAASRAGHLSAGSAAPSALHRRTTSTRTPPRWRRRRLPQRP